MLWICSLSMSWCDRDITELEPKGVKVKCFISACRPVNKDKLEYISAIKFIEIKIVSQVDKEKRLSTK